MFFDAGFIGWQVVGVWGVGLFINGFKGGARRFTSLRSQKRGARRFTFLRSQKKMFEGGVIGALIGC